MAKRFFDTQRIEEDWYINLSCKHRELLRYCESKCDGAGVFSFHEKIASTYINEKVTIADLEKLPVQKLENGKYFLSGFCHFQNGELSEKSPAHKPIFKSITENNINTDTLYNRLSDTLSNRVQEKERVIEKEQEIEKEKEGEVEKIKFPFESESFRNEWQRWKNFKKTEHRFSYKSQDSEQSALNELGDLARDELEAVKIIEKSIASGWKGFFALKNENGTHGKNGNHQRNYGATPVPAKGTDFGEL